VTAGFSSLANRPRIRSSTCSTTDVGERAAHRAQPPRHQVKLFGAVPMPTMNTRERPRSAVIVSNNCCLVADRAVGQEHHLPDMRRGVRAAIVQCAARIAGTISVPPAACSALTNDGRLRDVPASAGTAAGTARPWCRRSGSR
jgi:hypothetical protein